mgnify:CR=1 FL=1
MTQSEFKALKAQVEKAIDGKKSATPYNKATETLFAALKDHKALIKQYIDAGKYINRLNGMHDTADNIEDLIESVERQKVRRNWTYSDHLSYSLILQNID